mmetsp:Transcript_46184/g.128488  ORF Transcript_46184/g.128488 Transcript_46184/m.128488 type:complete len:246 (-) Transcript_46184:43-780(-)
MWCSGFSRQASSRRASSSSASCACAQHRGRSARACSPAVAGSRGCHRPGGCGWRTRRWPWPSVAWQPAAAWPPQRTSCTSSARRALRRPSGKMTLSRPTGVSPRPLRTWSGLDTPHAASQSGSFCPRGTRNVLGAVQATCSRQSFCMACTTGALRSRSVSRTRRPTRGSSTRVMVVTYHQFGGWLSRLLTRLLCSRASTGGTKSSQRSRVRTRRKLSRPVPRQRPQQLPPPRPGAFGGETCGHLQ